MHGAAEVVAATICTVYDVASERVSTNSTEATPGELQVEFICATYIRTLELLFISGQVLSGDPRYLTEGYTS